MYKLLSIIIPAYNAEKYLPELIDVLQPQLTDEVECVIVDDGSLIPVDDYVGITTLHKENGGAASARNIGLDFASGDYVSFIDADDIISESYVKTILEHIKANNPDYIYLSWKTIGDIWHYSCKLKKITDRFPAFNLCCWNRVYRRELITHKFNENKAIAEDAEFIRSFNEDGKKKDFITDFLYFYRTDSTDSLTKRFGRGQIEMDRIVYHLPNITNDMVYLIDEIAKLDKTAEVIIMTNNNALPELEKYAMIMKPTKIKGTELRGMPTPLFEKIKKPESAHIVIFTGITFDIGGIETWIYNFCRHMHEDYDIIVLYNMIDNTQKERLLPFARVEKNNGQLIECDTVIINRITDDIPNNIKYAQSIQMVHACKMVDSWTIPEDRNEIVAVSDVVKNSFNADCRVINNMTYPVKTEKVIILVSATRLKTFEKGENRMILFLNLLKKNGIKFLWYVFADKKLANAPEEMIFLKPRLDIVDYIARADYLVQLSDAEGFCYSIVEAMEVGTAVITTPLPVLNELGFKDGKNGYIVPFEIMTDNNIKRLLKVPKFKYSYDNETRKKQWKDIIPLNVNRPRYIAPKQIRITALQTYYDTCLERKIIQNETYMVDEDRAKIIIDAGYAKEVMT